MKCTLGAQRRHHVLHLGHWRSAEKAYAKMSQPSLSCKLHSRWQIFLRCASNWMVLSPARIKHAAVRTA